ncbi:hypothetical protein [Streptomyces griseus]|uniref:hypothetical protein n=1 Tax=Streptomyces griseus TaxID=1911 RepID=UPI0005672982|nr:hypothetical protein [Streptomyces griseus]
MTSPAPSDGRAPQRRWFRADSAHYGSLSPDGTLFLRTEGTTVEAVDDSGRRLWSASLDASGEGGGQDTGTASGVWAPDASEVLVFLGGWGHLLDADTGAERSRLPAVRGTAGQAAAVSPDGLRTALLSDPRTVTVHHRRTRATVHLPVGDEVCDLVWDPGGRLLCVATPTALQLWNPTSRDPSATPCSGRTALHAVAWSPDRRTLAFADAEGVHLVDAHGTAPAISANAPSVYGLGFSRTGRHLAVAGSGGVLVLDRELSPVAHIPGSPRLPADFSACAAGRLLVRTEQDGTAGHALWELPDTVEPASGRRTDAALQRWVAAMCGSVGRRVPEPGESPALRTGPPRPLGTGRDLPMPAFAWVTDGASAGELRPGLVALRRPAPGEPSRTTQPNGSTPTRPPRTDEPVWTAELPIARAGGAVDIEASAEALDPERADSPGAALAVATHRGTAELTVLDAATGTVRARLPGGQAPVWCPTGGGRLVVPEPGRQPAHLYLYELGEPPSATTAVSRFVRGRVGRPAWSPDGRLLAAGTSGEVLLWRMPEFALSSPRLRLPPRAFGTRVAWSPDGRRLAATCDAGSGPIVVWDTSDWQIQRELGAPGGIGWAPALAWSPDGSLLAAPGPGRSTSTVQIWDVAEASVVLTLEPPRVRGQLWSVRWSPDGRRIATTYGGGTTLVWELLTAGRAPSAPLPLPAHRLAELGTAAVAADAAVPLSTLTELLTLLAPGPADPSGPAAGGTPAGLTELLYGARAARALRALDWPPAAHPALAAVTATQLPSDSRYAAPSAVPAAELRSALERGLGGAAQDAPEHGHAAGALAAALERTRTRLLPALRLLGPDAVRQDPGLVHRVAQGLGRQGPGPDGRHPVPGLRLPASPVGDEITGPTAAGAPAGLVRHGPPDRMVPSQLALPDDVLGPLYTQEALLYRTRRGAAPPATRNAVLVLDTGPAAHGQVGTCLRVCAHALAEALLRAGRRVELLQLNGLSGPLPLAGPAELRALWQLSPPAPPDPVRAAERAAAALRRLEGGTLGTPRAVLLTHPHQRRLGLPGLLTVRVHYPGVPTTTDERDCWTLAPDPEPERLTAVLASLLAEL